ncbi:hypothetical protein HDU88_008737 [Geranomyces variabilis]|nr:hypothetical protein HDU88_008737 [Geranomyces variabilis]
MPCLVNCDSDMLLVQVTNADSEHKHVEATILCQYSQSTANGSPSGGAGGAVPGTSQMPGGIGQTLPGTGTQTPPAAGNTAAPGPGNVMPPGDANPVGDPAANNPTNVIGNDPVANTPVDGPVANPPVDTPVDNTPLNGPVTNPPINTPVDNTPVNTPVESRNDWTNPKIWWAPGSAGGAYRAFEAQANTKCYVDGGFDFYTNGTCYYCPAGQRWVSPTLFITLEAAKRNGWTVTAPGDFDRTNPEPLLSLKADHDENGTSPAKPACLNVRQGEVITGNVPGSPPLDLTDRYNLVTFALTRLEYDPDTWAYNKNHPFSTTVWEPKPLRVWDRPTVSGLEIITQTSPECLDRSGLNLFGNGICYVCAASGGSFISAHALIEDAAYGPAAPGTAQRRPGDGLYLTAAQAGVEAIRLTAALDGSNTLLPICTLMHGEYKAVVDQTPIDWTAHIGEDPYSGATGLTLRRFEDKFGWYVPVPAFEAEAGFWPWDWDPVDAAAVPNLVQLQKNKTCTDNGKLDVYQDDAARLNRWHGVAAKGLAQVASYNVKNNLVRVRQGAANCLILIQGDVYDATGKRKMDVTNILDMASGVPGYVNRKKRGLAAPLASRDTLTQGQRVVISWADCISKSPEGVLPEAGGVYVVPTASKLANATDAIYNTSQSCGPFLALTAEIKTTLSAAAPAIATCLALHASAKAQSGASSLAGKGVFASAASVLIGYLVWPF